ncbi:MAG TPA: hypothetical protein VD905_18945 [Flavobacteriales bacterium]|nr:hypothetical protein [Flavobacteriales bacterium]
MLKHFFATVCAGFLLTLTACYSPGLQRPFFVPACPVNIPETEILTRKGIDSVLGLLPTVDFKALDSTYLCYSDPENKFCRKLASQQYYMVKGDQVFWPLVGKYRIGDFMTPDRYYTQNMRELCAGHTQYWLVDKKMLYMMLDLILALDEKGYNKYGFRVNIGHRHPAWNDGTPNSAKFSQHIYGRAVDISVRDIDNDFVVTQQDKEIVLTLLEKIVGSKGGIGKYPGSMGIHFDSRGTKARWDQH